MKTSFKLFLINWFAIGVQLLAVLLAIRFSGLSADYLKAQLKSANLYPLIAKSEITQNMKAFEGDKNLSAAITPTINKYFTAEYVQQKTEKLIDDTDAWIHNETKAEPVLSFKEIKTELVAKNPKLMDNLKKMSDEAKVQLAEQKKEGNLDPVMEQQLEGLSKINPDGLLENLNNDLSFPLGDTLQPLKVGYTFYSTGLYVVVFVLLLILGIIMLLCDNTKSRFNWAGITFIISSIYAVIIGVPAYFLMKTSVASLLLNIVNIKVDPETASKNAQELGNGIVLVIDTLFKNLAAKFLTMEYMTFGVLVAAGVTCFILAFITQPASAIGGNRPDRRK